MMAENYSQIGLSKLPEPLRGLAKAWLLRGARVATRTDDAGEYRIMKLRGDEPPWVGWSMVNFNG